MAAAASIAAEDGSAWLASRRQVLQPANPAAFEHALLGVARDVQHADGAVQPDGLVEAVGSGGGAPTDLPERRAVPPRRGREPNRCLAGSPRHHRPCRIRLAHDERAAEASCRLLDLAADPHALRGAGSVGHVDQAVSLRLAADRRLDLAARDRRGHVERAPDGAAAPAGEPGELVERLLAGGDVYDRYRRARGRRGRGGGQHGPRGGRRWRPLTREAPRRQGDDGHGGERAHERPCPRPSGRPRGVRRRDDELAGVSAPRDDRRGGFGRVRIGHGD